VKVGDLIQVDDGRHALFNGHIGIVTGKHHFAIGDPGDDYIYDVYMMTEKVTMDWFGSQLKVLTSTESCDTMCSESEGEI
tara:strand:+ start:176 stop:415 length:240 start_codon:yes stop_codon:yes gene_type:complete